MLKTYFTFVVNPKKNLPQLPYSNKVKVFLLVLFVTYLLILLISILPSQEREAIELSISSRYLPIIIAPIYEELVFRLGLRLNIHFLFLSLSLLISSILVILLNPVLNFYEELVFYYLFSVALSIPIFLILRLSLFQRRERVLQIVKQNYNYLFFGSLFLFSISHFAFTPFNLTDFTTYLVYGYSLGFLRIATNFFYSVILHFILVLPVLISMF